MAKKYSLELEVVVKEPKDLAEIKKWEHHADYAIDDETVTVYNAKVDKEDDVTADVTMDVEMDGDFYEWVDNFPINLDAYPEIVSFEVCSIIDKNMRKKKEA